MADHWSGGEMERLARGGMTRSETREAVRHLLQGCEPCYEQLRLLLDRRAAGPAGLGGEYDAAITRALAGVLSRQPLRKPGDGGRVARGLDLARSRPRGVHGLTDEEAEELRGVPFVEVLVELSFEERYRDPGKMLHLAILARLAAENLDPGDYDPPVIADHQARAWAELGNALRINDDLRGAEAALNTAEARLEQGTGNLDLLARVADLRASLLSAQRRFPDACELLDGVCQIYRKLGDDHLAGRALVSQGIYTDYEGDPARALRLLQEGLSLLDRDRDPQLVISTMENLLQLMVHCGRFREAARMLLESSLRQSLAGQPLNLIKLRAVEGQIHAGLGRPGHAESALLEARSGFLDHNLGYRAALVGLDLAAVWLEQGKSRQVRELASDMLATFERLGIQREGVRALDYLHRACEQATATPALVLRVSRFLHRLEREPQLRFAGAF